MVEILWGCKMKPRMVTLGFLLSVMLMASVVIAQGNQASKGKPAPDQKGGNVQEVVDSEPYGGAPGAKKTEASPTGEAKSSEGSSAGASAAGAAGTPAEVKSSEGEVASEAVKEADTSSYSVKIRDMEQRIGLLKEQIFKSKARLSLLAETVLDKKIAGARAVITHQNEMGSSFQLVKAVFSLDGAPIFNKIDEDGSLSDKESMELFNGNIVPGDHTLSVMLEYQGNGYGIFAYLRGYKFRVRSSHTFTATEGHTIQLKVVGYEKGGATASLEERPAIKFIEEVSKDESSSGDKAGKS